MPDTFNPAPPASSNGPIRDIDGTMPTGQVGNAWQANSLRALVLADRKTVKLDRAVLLQILAQRDTPDQVVADLVSMFTNNGEPF
jgi:hypothetical protein